MNNNIPMPKIRPLKTYDIPEKRNQLVMSEESKELLLWIESLTKGEYLKLPIQDQMKGSSKQDLEIVHKRYYHRLKALVKKIKGENIKVLCRGYDVYVLKE